MNTRSRAHAAAIRRFEISSSHAFFSDHPPVRSGRLGPCNPISGQWALSQLNHQGPARGSDVQSYRSMADMTSALRRKDDYTWAHSRRVSTLAAATGLQMGLTGSEIEDVSLGGLLHDVGKLLVPGYLLRKAGPLSASEYRIVSAHSENGARLLEAFFPPSSTVVKIARWHHNRVDGVGVRDGVSGAAIPLAARIVAVADSYDAMTSTRPYRPMMPAGAALRELESNVSGQFDRDCVAAFERALHPGSPGVAYLHLAA